MLGAGMTSSPLQPLDATEWRAQELLLMREVMGLVGHSIAPKPSRLAIGAGLAWDNGIAVEP